MGKEDILARRSENEVNQLVWVVHLSSHVNAAQLGDVELEVISDPCVEVRVYTTALEIFDCVVAVGIELDQSLDGIQVVVNGGGFLRGYL